MQWRFWILAAAGFFAFLPTGQAAPGCGAKSAGDIKIVIDVGHTATDGGALSARGVREYEFNLKLAQRIEAEFKKAGFRQAYLMVTEANGQRGLFQRVKRANAMNARLFLSIHHDSVADAYLERWTYGGKEFLYSDRSKGFSLHVSPRNGRYRESLRLAESLADALLGRGLNPTTNPELSMPKSATPLEVPRGIYRRLNLAVLDFTNMTALLLEAGMIVNRDEELVLASEVRQDLVASAVAEAAGKFCGVPLNAAGAQAAR